MIGKHGASRLCNSPGCPEGVPLSGQVRSPHGSGFFVERDKRKDCPDVREEEREVVAEQQVASAAALFIPVQSRLRG